MKKIIAIVSILLSTLTTPLSTQCHANVLGNWNIYPAYKDVSEMAKAGNKIYVLSLGALYSYNSNDDSIETYDKSKTLNGSSISHIAWCETVKRLVIVYDDQNIDLLDENGMTYNISDYYSKSMAEDKTVNNINVEGAYAYLSTGFGIVKVNVRDAYIRETYNLGFPVNWTHTDSERIYAESATAGQYSAPIKGNLLDKASWTRTADYQKENKTMDAELLALAASHRPDGPVMNNFGFMRYVHGRLYTVAGYDGMRKAYTQIKEGDKWTIINDDISYLSTHRYRAIFEIDVDPNNKEHWRISAETGLYEFLDGKVVNEYYCANSPLQKAASVSATSTNYTLIPSSKYDEEGNLWILNGIQETPGIYKLDPSGNFTFYPHEEMRATPEFGWVRPTDALFDCRGLLWFVNNDWRVPAVACYDTKTDRLRTFTSIINQDASQLTLGYVRCITEDREGNLWIGTNVGPVEYRASDVEDESSYFQQIKVPRNDGTNLADYLLAGIDVTCITVDGANRKWFGTNGYGVYCVSSDNIEQVYHFTADNSPLLSDIIESLEFDHQTGEVYIGTEKGLCSYTTDATSEADELDSETVYAYPNPVTPDYNGKITVMGLTFNASIKVTTVSGELVAEGHSNGGTFTWDGCDLQGRRVASGVYMVMAATEDGKKGTVCKIAVVR